MEAKLLKVLHFKIIPFNMNWLYMQLFCTQIKTIIKHWNIYFCLMQEQFKLILTARDITFEYYIQKLTEGSTNGMELSILTLCEIFGISVMVLCENHLWKSDELPLDEFHMYFIMFKTGWFMSTSKRSGQKFLLQMPHTLQQFLNTTLHGNHAYDITSKKKRGRPKKNIEDTTVTVDSSDVSTATTSYDSLENEKDSWDMSNTKYCIGV